MLAGLAGGFIAGFLGGGGGIVYILVIPPSMQYLAGITGPEIASYTVANSIFSIAVTTFFGSLAHLRLKAFYVRETLVVGLSGAALSIVLLHFFVNTDLYTPLLFNAIVVFLLFVALVNGFTDRFLNEPLPAAGYSKPQLAVAGGVAGVVSAVSGLGGGLVFIPVMKYWLRMGIMKAKSISLGMIFITTLVMSIFNMLVKSGNGPNQSLGMIVFPVVLPIVAGVVVGAPIGVFAAHRLKARVVNRAFLILMGFVFLKKALDLLSMIS